jgi:cell division protease FtsH
VLTAHRDALEAMAQALMEYETISGEECEALMRGEKIVRKIDDEETRGPAGPAVPLAGKMRPPRSEPGTGGLEPQPQT